MKKDWTKTVTILQSEYDDLCKDQEFLEALRRAGVDNWEGYEYAMEENRNSDE
jgi:hypothetical protein